MGVAGAFLPSLPSVAVQKTVVQVGGWSFEPHRAKGKSNDTRARWLVLALSLDLEEKLCHHVLSYGCVPTKLGISWQGILVQHLHMQVSQGLTRHPLPPPQCDRLRPLLHRHQLQLQLRVPD